MKRLETPPTLRIPNLDEVPKSKDVIDNIEKSKNAKIIEGFTLKDNPTNDLPFKFYAEINVDNSRLWDLFKTLVQHLPNPVSLIFNHADDEPIYGKYSDTYLVLNTLGTLSIELTQDCFLEFGAIHQTEVLLEEVFVDCTKYIKYWGMDEIWFRKIMSDYNLFEIQDLNFIDEFPKVREPLRLYKKDVLETETVIEQLKSHFT